MFIVDVTTWIYMHMRVHMYTYVYIYMYMYMYANNNDAHIPIYDTVLCMCILYPTVAQLLG